MIYYSDFGTNFMNRIVVTLIPWIEAVVIRIRIRYDIKTDFIRFIPVKLLSTFMSIKLDGERQL